MSIQKMNLDRVPDVELINKNYAYTRGWHHGPWKLKEFVREGTDTKMKGSTNITLEISNMRQLEKLPAFSKIQPFPERKTVAVKEPFKLFVAEMLKDLHIPQSVTGEGGTPVMIQGLFQFMVKIIFTVWYIYSSIFPEEKFSCKSE